MGGDQSAEVLRSWRGLYKAALFETDRSKIRSRIEEARSALVFRSRELFVTSPNCDDETEAIENALYALRALENCLRLNTKDRRHVPRTEEQFPAKGRNTSEAGSQNLANRQLDSANILAGQGEDV